MRPLYLRLFFRIIKRNLDVYILKVATLSIAFACTLVITVFVSNEFGYDRFHKNPGSVFRVLQRNNLDDFSGNRYTNHIPNEVVKLLRSSFADSVSFSPVNVVGGLDIFADGKTWHGMKLHVADPSIADIFTFDLTGGSWINYGSQGPGIVLSSSASRQYFGTDSSIGRTLNVSAAGDTVLFTVAAVFRDFPVNSHEEFDAFITHDAVTLHALGIDAHNPGLYGRIRHKSIGHFQSWIDGHVNDGVSAYELQPLPEIYFGPRVIGEDAKHGDEYSIYILISITSLILFLAMTGFINLTTLTLPHRSKELAVKKIAGTGQSGLLYIFAKESFLIVMTSLTIAILAIVLMHEWILPVLATDVFSLFKKANLSIAATLVLLLLVFVLSPLLFTARFTRASPIRLLGSETITFPNFKRVIAFLQLGLSLFLIVASIVIRRQVNYSLVKEPGQNHDQVVYLDFPNHLSKSVSGLRTSLKMNNANVVDLIATSQLPHRISSKDLNDDFYFIKVDPEFKEFFNLKMIEGNWFKANDGDSIYVVNARAKQLLGADTANVIGTFQNIGEQFNLPDRPLKIFRSNNFEYNFLCIRILEVDVRRTVSALSNYFANGGKPAAIRFLNKRFEQWLSYQDRLNQLSEIMAVISALLASCGIYGLCVSLVREKTKQIAIHKLFGARTHAITLLLAKEFAIQLLVAVLIFAPLTFLVIQESLRHFIYRTHFVWLDPLIPLIYCIVVISLLCSIQAGRLNRSDLTSSLKS